MKAIIYEKYGSPEVLQLKEVTMPVVKNNEVLIRIHATSVNSGDVRLRKADPFAVRLLMGLFRPRKKILGVVFAGVVESAGNEVTRFKEGDKVYGSTGMNLGTYAEYICVAETALLHLKPKQMTYKEAAAIPFGTATALHFLRKAKIQEGQKVLIYGASGAIGTAAVQLANYFGADVTGVCSRQNLDLVRSLGAHKAIDYKTEDFSKNGETYDVIFDTVGKSPFSGSLKSLSDSGYYLRAVHMDLVPIIKGLWTSLTTRKKVIGGVVGERAEDLIFFNELIETGDLKAIIDRCYSLEEIVEAHTYVERGHKRETLSSSYKLFIYHQKINFSCNYH